MIKLGTKILLFLVLAFFVLAGSYLIFSGYFAKEKVLQKETKKEEAAESQQEKPKEPEFVIKESALIEIPYTVQAPFANWAVHEESCEEAAALMLDYFLKGVTKFDGQSIIPQTSASEEMVKMKNWQVANYGKEPDLTAEQWGKFAKEYYGYNYQVFKEIKTEDIKREISKGNPVVVPVMTHSLGNPHYGARDSYHVIVIKGYKAEGVITNDPGVKEGESYFYSWDILFKAIDAQTPKTGQGREMVILKK